MGSFKKSLLFVVVAGVIGVVLYLGAKWFGLIGPKEDTPQ